MEVTNDKRFFLFESRLVEWLDESTPGSFRQAQVSFSSRLPKAIPLGDASTLSTHLTLFNPFHVLDLRHLLHLDGPIGSSGTPLPQSTSAPHVDLEDQEEDEASEAQAEPSCGSNRTDPVHHSPCRPREEKTESAPLQASPSPVVAMVTKHANGTLNLWHLALSDQSKFTQVLSVSHATRISGHRFRVNNISCHPVLPLLLTTSHHNVINSPDGDAQINPCDRTSDVLLKPRANFQILDWDFIIFKVQVWCKLSSNDSIIQSDWPVFESEDIFFKYLDKEVFGLANLKVRRTSGQANHGYCSELILWKVETVGPLGKSGGVTELARINSPHMSAFASVAWIPTVLPRQVRVLNEFRRPYWMEHIYFWWISVRLLGVFRIRPALASLLQTVTAYESIRYVGIYLGHNMDAVDVNYTMFFWFNLAFL